MLLPSQTNSAVKDGSGTVSVSSYLAGEGARAGTFGFGVLDSAVLVGIEHPPCKRTDRLSKLHTADSPFPSGTEPGWRLFRNTSLVCLCSTALTVDTRFLQFVFQPGSSSVHLGNIIINPSNCTEINCADLTSCDKSLSTGSPAV